MSDINELILFELNLMSAPSKATRDPKAPWAILGANTNTNYNPHLQVRPLSTQVHKLQASTNVAQNTNKQPIVQRTPRNVNVQFGYNQNQNQGPKALYTHVGGAAPSQRHVGWSNKSPLSIK